MDHRVELRMERIALGIGVACCGQNVEVTPYEVPRSGDVESPFGSGASRRQLVPYSFAPRSTNGEYPLVIHIHRCEYELSYVLLGGPI